MVRLLSIGRGQVDFVFCVSNHKTSIRNLKPRQPFIFDPQLTALKLLQILSSIIPLRKYLEFSNHPGNWIIQFMLKIKILGPIQFCAAVLSSLQLKLVCWTSRSVDLLQITTGHPRLRGPRWFHVRTHFDRLPQLVPQKIPFSSAYIPMSIDSLFVNRETQ